MAKRSAAPTGRTLTKGGPLADTKRNPSVHRNQKLKQRYGMTEAQYNTIIERQQGRCGICHRFRKLVVDHEHRGGRVRGLLCSNCNSALGLFEESVPALRRAISYIKHHHRG